MTRSRARGTRSVSFLSVLGVSILEYKLLLRNTYGVLNSLILKKSCKHFAGEVFLEIENASSEPIGS